MALLNHVKKELSAKIVYYGPGLSGKTTNLEWIHKKMQPDKRGKLISLETKTDRTLFFDFLPVEIGEIEGYRVRFNVYTVPGQIFYNETRKMVLKGVDGVVFVADSQKELSGENRESLKNLEENLRTLGRRLDEIPLVLQYNKRDLQNAMSVQEMDRLLNSAGVPCFESVAIRGEGVLTTLARIARMVADHVRVTLFKQTESVEPTAPGPLFAAHAQAPLPEGPGTEVPGVRTRAKSPPTSPADVPFSAMDGPGSLMDPDFSPVQQAPLRPVSETLVDMHERNPWEALPEAGGQGGAGAAPAGPSETVGTHTLKPEALGDFWLDPSIISVSPDRTASGKMDDSVTVRLGTAEVANENEIRIPIRVRRGKAGEEIPLQLLIRIDPQGNK